MEVDPGDDSSLGDGRGETLSNLTLTSPPPPRSPNPATGTKRDKKEFSQRQLQLPQKQIMSCRHCNEAEKDEAKAERRKSLDESRELKGGEVHNKGRQVHNNFKSMSRVA